MKAMMNSGATHFLGAMLIASASAAQVTPPPPAPFDFRFDANDGLYTSQDGEALNWPAGVYTISGDIINGAVTSFCFVLNPVDTTGVRSPRKNLTINAIGTVLRISDPTLCVFFLTGCDGMTINGLRIIYDPLPFNQSTITAVNLGTNTIDVAVDPGYLDFSDPFFAYGAANPVHYGVLFDPITTLPKAGSNGDTIKVLGALPLGGSSFRLTMEPTQHPYLEHFSAGDRFAYIGRRLGAGAFRIHNFEPTAIRPNCFTLDGCTIIGSPNLTVNLQESPSVASTGQAVIRNCTVTTASQNDLVSGGANLMAENCRVGPLVENCTFERFADDGLDFHGNPRSWAGYPALPDTSVVDLTPGPRLAKDDSLQLFFPSTGAVSVVVIDNILSGGDKDQSARVQLKTPAPGMDSATQVWNLSASSGDFVVQNNTFRNHRRFGALVSTKGGLIAGNVFEGCASHAIRVANTFDVYKEGPVPSDITIRSNTITNCGYTYTSSIAGSSVYIGGVKASDQPADTQSVSNIILEGNTIKDWNTFGICAIAVQGSQIRKRLGTYNVFKGAVSPASRAIAILSPAGTTTVNGVNTGSATGLQYAVTIGNGVDASVTASQIIVHSGTFPLEDLR